MTTQFNQNEQVSCMVDNELTKEQLHLLLKEMKQDVSGSSQSTWNIYHQIGDSIRSDDLNVNLSAEFNVSLSRLIAKEPTIFAPTMNVEKIDIKNLEANSTMLKTGVMSKYGVLTGIAASFFVAIALSSQYFFPFDLSENQLNVAQNKNDDLFMQAPLHNANHPEVSELEFAPKLMSQVEMLRDPDLDSYLLAHQKASPAIASAGRYVKQANIPSSTETEK